MAGGTPFDDAIARKEAGFTSDIPGAQRTPFDERIQEQEQISMAAGVARSFGQGLVGLGDELEAAVRALASEREEGEDFSDAYNRHLRNARDALEQFRAENPGISLTSEIVGSLAIPGGAAFAAGKMIPPVGRALQALGQTRTVGQAARRGSALGGAGGAAFGAGSGEGVEGRLTGAVAGGVLGAGVGAALPLAVAGVGKVAGGLGVRNFIGTIVGQIPGMTSKGANRALAKALQRDFPELPPLEGARKLEGLLEEALKGNPTATLADVAGANVQALVTQRAVSVPGAGREIVDKALGQRQKRQLARVATALRRGTNVDERRSRVIIQDQIDKRKIAAAPLYRAAYRLPLTQTAVDEIEDVVSSPIGAEAKREAMKLIRSGTPGRAKIKWEEVSPVERADMVKKALDDEILTAKPQRLAILTQLSNRLRDAVDNDLISTQGKSVYAEARDAFGTPSQYIDAIRKGGEAFQPAGTIDDVTEFMATATAAAKQAFRIGAVNKLIDTMRKDRASLPDMLKFFRSPDVRDRLRAIMPTPESRKQIERVLSAEDQASTTFRKSQGSRTDLLRAEREDAENAAQAVEMVLSIVSDAGVSGLIARKMPGLAGRLADTRVARQTAVNARRLTAKTAKDAQPSPLFPPGASPRGSRGRGAQAGAVAGSLVGGPLEPLTIDIRGSAASASPGVLGGIGGS